MTLKAVSIAILAAAVLGASAASASAALPIQTARFHGTLSGSQSSSWTMNSQSTCSSVAGSGKQTFVYHQKQPFTLVFWRYKDNHAPPGVYVPGRKRSGGIAVTGTASREGKQDYTIIGNCPSSAPLDPNTPYTPPPAPDCGSRHYDGVFYPNWWRPDVYPGPPDEPTPLGPVFALSDPSPMLQWVRCPFYGPLIMQGLTHAYLFDKAVFGTRKTIDLHDSVHRIDRNGNRVAQGVVADTTVSFKMRLTRIH
jgi:hypothetical protein